MRRWKVAVVIASAVVLVSSPVWGAGFAIFEQGAKAMGMAGAFAAQADDPSAMFHNVGGLGLFEEREFYAGASLISLGDSDFRGEPPFPGPTQSGTQKGQVLLLPHFYWVEPLAERWTFGLAVNAPFGLTTEWENPDTWSGRFISEKAALTALDVNPNLGFRPRENLGIGFGLVARVSAVELHRRQAALNPFSGAQAEVARAVLESDRETGVGFTVGFLHRAGDRFSWGLNYRSPIEIDYGGDAVLTQRSTGNAAFDAIVASTTPFGQKLPIETSIEFPDQAFLGFAFQATDAVLVEADVVWHGWSTFDSLPLTFTQNPTFSSDIPQLWDDTAAYRFGVSWDRSERVQWRFGFYYDETPQPAERVGPLLPDADRNGFTVGFGHEGERLRSDYYVLFVPFNDRTTTVNADGFNGSYEGSALLLGATFGW